MIQIGPLKLEDAIAGIMGIKEGKYRRLATGEELIIQAPSNTIRFRFRMEKWKKPELIEMVRNTQIQSLPFYTGQEYMSGNYLLKSLRENPLNSKVSDFEIVAERAGHYTRKLQDVMLRQDDWTVLVNEDFESASSIDETILPKFRNMHDGGTHSVFTIATDGYTAISGTKVWKHVSTGYKMIALWGTHWRNYHYSAWVMASHDDQHGLVWRAEEGNIEGWTDSWSKSASNYANRGRHYRFVVDTSNNKYIIQYVNAWGTGGTTAEIFASQEGSLINQTWYHLEVISVGDTHYCFANGQLIHYFEDTRAKGGMVGTVMNTSTTGRILYVEDIVVHEIPYTPIVLDESYAEPSSSPLKTRETPRGVIGYFERPDVSYRMTKGGNNCVMHLRFDQPYGNKVFDLSGNGNHGLLCGAKWSEAGYISTKKSKSNAATDGSYIRVPHDSTLNTDSEGTLIIRMRRRGVSATTFTWLLMSKGTGAWYVQIWGLSGGNHTLGWCQEMGGGCTGEAPQVGDHDIPSGNFQTYIIRWSKSRETSQIFIDGRLAAGPITWYAKGSDTTDDLLIGNAEVDIEYVILYDKFLEFPEIPDGFGARLLDADSHHEHEIFDVRWNDEPAHVREHWNDLSWTTSGLEYQDDRTTLQNHPLLFRRGSAVFWDLSDYAYTDLPTHIKKNLHKSDWTIEVVVSHVNGTPSPGTYDIISIGSTDGTTKTIGMMLYRGPTGGTFLRCYLNTSYGVEEKSMYEYKPIFVSNQKCSIIHLCYFAGTNSLKCYVDGKHTDDFELTGTINDTLDRLFLGKRIATGSGLQWAAFYRARIIASTLSKDEVKQIFNEYIKPAVQVFGEHEFKGYPEFNNGLLSMRPTTNFEDKQFGERALWEVYDNGSYVLAQGNTAGSDQPMDVGHKITDEEATYNLRLWEMNPVVRRVSQDNVEVELRSQFRKRGPLLSCSGIYARQRVELSIGAFAIDTEIQINTRCTDWEFQLKRNDMQTLWQEGSWIKYQETSGDDIWRTFISCNGVGAMAKTLDGTPSNSYFENYTILANWSNHDYILGIMLSRMDDHMRVVIAADDAELQGSVVFDSIKGSKLRVTIGIIPWDKSKIYHSDNGFTPVNFAVESPVANAIDDNTMRADQLGSAATLVKNISYEPGVYRVWFDVIFTIATQFLMSIYDGSGYFRSMRKQRIDSGMKAEQMWFDTDLVVNAESAETLTTKLTIRDADNSGSNVIDFDGCIILPLWNGADFILDQLYLARQLKLTRRVS